MNHRNIEINAANFEIKAGDFKAKCLSLMDEVKNKRITITITKHGHPVAKLVPIAAALGETYGCLKDTVSIQGDIIEPLDTSWESAE